MGLRNTVDHCRPGCHCLRVMMDDKYPLFMVQAIPNDGTKFLTFQVLSVICRAPGPKAKESPSRQMHRFDYPQLSAQH